MTAAPPLDPGDTAAAQRLLAQLQSQFGHMSRWMPMLDSMERVFRGLPEDQRGMLHRYLFPADAAQLREMHTLLRDPQRMADVMAQADAARDQDPLAAADGMAAGRPMAGMAPGMAPATAPRTSAGTATGPAMGTAPNLAPMHAAPAAPHTPFFYAQPPYALQAAPPPLAGSYTAWGGAPVNTPSVVIHAHPQPWACNGNSWGGDWSGVSPYPFGGFNVFNPVPACFAAPPCFGGPAVFGLPAGLMIGGGVGGMLGAGLGASLGAGVGGALAAGLGALAYSFL